VPDLAAVIAKATPTIRNAGRGDPNRSLIQNVVTVDRGIVRVREVVAWDQGGYPLSGDPAERGQRAISPAVAKFMGSSVRGHLASEIVVDIDDAQDVELKCEHDRKFHGRKKGSANPSDPHVPARTIEILVSNYEPASAKPTPWGLDFQWLFEAAGYHEAELGGPEFDAWVKSGYAYDQELFENERAMFLSGASRSIGRPFPYMESAGSLTPLQPLTNYPNWWVCVFAVVPSGYTVMYTETIKQPDGTVITREWKLVPGALAVQKKSAIKKAPAKKAPVKKTATKKTSTKPKKSAKPKRPGNRR
jgi:hypothetical protein